LAAQRLVAVRFFYSGRGSVPIAIEFPIPPFVGRCTSRRATAARNARSNGVANRNSEHEAENEADDQRKQQIHDATVSSGPPQL
jgi:hypothetical protein